MEHNGQNTSSPKTDGEINDSESDYKIENKKKKSRARDVVEDVVRLKQVDEQNLD